MVIKSNKTLVLFGLACLLSAGVKAQQDPQFSMNMNTKLFVNPAYAGMNDGICAYMLGRQQWTGFEGRPETYLFGAHGTFTIPGINLRSGGGLSMMGDGLGQMHFFGLKGSYSAHIPLSFIGGKPGYLGVGLAAGLIQFGIGNNWRSFDDYFIDPIIPDEGYQASKLDLDAGLYYKTDDLYFGVSVTHLNSAKFDGEGNTLEAQFPGIAKAWNSTFVMTQHIYVIAGYDFALPSNPLFVLKPSVFVKTEAVSAQVDLNMLVEWNNFAWGGLTYRYTDAVALMGGLIYQPGKGTIRAGYAYDVTTSRLNQGSNGSHEIFLQYCLSLRKKPPVQKHKSVRFL